RFRKDSKERSAMSASQKKMEQILQSVTKEGDKKNLITEAHNLTVLAGELYRAVQEEEMNATSPDSLAASIKGLYDFIKTRRKDEIKVRVFVPEEGKGGWGNGATVVEVLN